MADYRLTPEAREDLVEIGEFTDDRWGEDQRQAYMVAFAETFRAIAEGTAQIRKSDGIKPGLRSCLMRRHVIFFRHNRDGAVEIIRILHASQDHVRHL